MHYGSVWGQGGGGALSVYRLDYGLDGRPWGSPSLHFNGYRGTFPVITGRSVTLTPQLHFNAEVETQWKYTAMFLRGMCGTTLALPMAQL
jgi:hypothetical protein